MANDDADKYTLCSASSLNDTEDGLIGPGRTLGMVYGLLGEKLENVAGRIAVKVLHRGPQETGKNILTVHGKPYIYLRDRKTGQDVRTLNPQYNNVKLIRKKCKRLNRYVR